MIGKEKQKRPSKKSEFALGKPSVSRQVAALGKRIDVDRPDIQGVMNASFVREQEELDNDITKDLDIDFYTNFIKESVVPKKTVDRLYQGTESLLNLIDTYEGFGGSDYSLLWNNAHKGDTPFKGVDVSNMTLDQLLTFSRTSGDYGQYVKSTNPEGVVGTPMGRYNIVGTTLRDAAKGLGLPGDTKFTPEVQDEMFLWLVNRRIQKAKGNQQALLDEIRKEFAGFKKVPDDTLLKALDNFRMSPRPKTKPKGLGER